MKSPCLICQRVRDPRNCENKNCKEWRDWYIARWEAMRRQVFREIAGTPVEDRGVPLGGHRYASPHRVREFMAQDPCDSCHCVCQLCAKPCPLKLAWLDQKGGCQ